MKAEKPGFSARISCFLGLFFFEGPVFSFPRLTGLQGQPPDRIS
jgi:hypothetical protein